MKKSRTATTAKAVQNLKPDTRRMEYRAGPPGGLGLIVHPSGRKVWCLRYVVGKRTRKLTLGVYPMVGLADARQKAVDALRVLDKGTDPALKPAEGADAIMALAETWLKREVAKTRTAKATENMFRKEVVEPWKTKRLGDIGKPEILSLVDAIVDRGAGVSANRVFSIMRRFFNWAAQRGYVAASPLSGLKEPTVERPRDHVLTAEELGAVWAAAGTMSFPHGPWLRMLMLCGQRRTETATMKWSDLDLAKGVWQLPATSAKMDKPNDVPLSAPALEILRSLPRFVHGDYVWTHSNGQAPLTTYYEAKEEVDAVIEAQGHKVEAWTFHDLRRNLSTFFAENGIPPHVAELVLSHSASAALGSVASIYNRYSYATEKREALDTWARYLQGLEGKPAATTEASA